MTPSSKGLGVSFCIRGSMKLKIGARARTAIALLIVTDVLIAAAFFSKWPWPALALLAVLDFCLSIWGLICLNNDNS